MEDFYNALFGVEKRQHRPKGGDVIGLFFGDPIIPEIDLHSLSFIVVMADDVGEIKTSNVC